MVLLNGGWISISHQRQTRSADQGRRGCTYLDVSALGQMRGATGSRRGWCQADGCWRLHRRRGPRVTRPGWGIGDQALVFLVGVAIGRAGNGSERAK